MFGQCIVRIAGLLNGLYICGVVDVVFSNAT
jgi:hypothetical protein